MNGANERDDFVVVFTIYSAKFYGCIWLDECDSVEFA